jgi:hypothetical protein
MLDDIERIESRGVEWNGRDYPPEIDRLMRAVYDHHLIVRGFDWPSWREEAMRFEDPEVIRTASLDDVRRLFTMHVRQDRFFGGYFADVTNRGHISALLRRLVELAA